MPVPSLITELSETAGLNSPPGGEDVFPQLDNYLRAHAAFIAQLRQTIAAQQLASVTQKYQIACSDLTSDLDVNAEAAYFDIQADITVTEVSATVAEGSTSGAVTLDVWKNGVTMLSTLLTIDQNETTSLTAAVPAVVSSTTLLKGDRILIKITVPGAGARGLIFALQGVAA